MVSEIEFKPLGDSEAFFAREKFPSGMTGEFTATIYAHNTNIETIEIYISLVLFRKRKTRWDIFGEVTGKDHLRPAVWAKQCLSDVEYLISTELLRGFSHQYKYVDVCIGWESPRLKEVYGLILYPKGYDLGKDSEGDWTYRKRFNRFGMEAV